MNKIAILIPCFNEEKTIEKVILDIQKYLPDANIYVYDNNCTDHTIEKAKSLGVNIGIEKKQGKGNVIKTMFEEIDADCYIMVDGDDTYDISNIKSIATKVLDNNVDMVIGNRLQSHYFKENKRLISSIGNKFLVRFVYWLFKVDIKDVLTGLRGFSNKFVKEVNIKSKGFEIETELTITAILKKYTLDFVNIDYRQRPNGSYSKLKVMKDGFKIIFTLCRMYYNKLNHPRC